jgi:DNA-binding NarL/FixJ family response regulator
MLAEGLTNKEIAAALNISPRTVEVHRSKLMLKLGVKSHGELVRMLVQRKISIQRPSPR